jgi:sterol 24-C-methyltransferase
MMHCFCVCLVERVLFFVEQILMEEDLAKKSQVPWYQPLDPNHFSLTTLRLTPIGRFFTHNMV